jgi:hypothetical protein
MNVFVILSTLTDKRLGEDTIDYSIIWTEKVACILMKFSSFIVLLQFIQGTRMVAC